MHKDETQFVKIARKAVSFVGADPVHAWNMAARHVSDKKSIHDKGCPRSAFLGMCEEGMVRAMPRGRYLRQRKQGKGNKAYALEAVRLLEMDASLADQPSELWQRVMRSLGEDENKRANGQMDVVLALWNINQIITAQKARAEAVS